MTSVTVRAGLIETHQNTPVRCGFIALLGAIMSCLGLFTPAEYLQDTGLLSFCFLKKSHITSRLIKGFAVSARLHSNITAILHHRCSVVMVHLSLDFSFIDHCSSFSLTNVSVPEHCNRFQEDV